MSQISVFSPDDAPEAIMQNGPLFDPVIYTSLVQIVNELDPSSFVKFARTCKDLHNVCYNAKGIQVEFPCVIVARPTEFTETDVAVKKKTGAHEFRGRNISEQELQKLQKMPVILVVKTIAFYGANYRLLEEVRQLLSRFGRVVVELVESCWTVNWNQLVQFLQDFNVKRVDMWWDTAIPANLLPFFLTKLDHFYYNEHVTDDLIVSATAKHLLLPYSRISKNTLMDLLQKFANEDIVDWTIGREPHDAGESDPFIEACSEVMKVVKMEEIDSKKMESSVLYRTPNKPRKFYLRKPNGFIGKVKINEHSVHYTGTQF